MRKKFYITILVSIFVLLLVACGKKNTLSDTGNISDTAESIKETQIESKDEVKEGVGNVLTKNLDDKYKKDVEQVINREIEAGNIPGAVVLAVKDGNIFFEEAYGYAHLNKIKKGSKIDSPIPEKLENPVKMEKDTLFDLASVTKITATTQAIMKLDSEGKLDVNDTVVKYIPEFSKNGKDTITIKELLTHTSGLPQWKPSFFYVNNDRKKMLDYICNLSPIFEKGEVKYSDFGFMTLGYIVEKISGKSLNEYVESEIYKPLGMNNTFYKPLEHGIKESKIAATSLGNPFEYRMVDEEKYPDFGYDTTEDQKYFKDFNGWRNRVLIGEVNDGNTGMASDGIAGQAGLYSTAEDLAILGQLMLNGGEYNGVKIYEKSVLDEYVKNHTGEAKRGYGFELAKKYMGQNANEKMYGHNGFTGTHFYMDPENNMVIIVLTNKQNVGLNEKGSYASTFKFVGEISDILKK